MHIKDIESIFFPAIYDDKHKIIKLLQDMCPSSMCYSLKGIIEVLYSWDVARTDTMRESLKKLKKEYAITDESLIRSGDFLIACISRNPDRIKKVINQDQYTIDIFGLCVVIDNGDVKSLETLLADEAVLAYIRKIDLVLLQRSIFSREKAIFECLLGAIDYCDLKVLERDHIRKWSFEEQTTQYQEFFLLDIVKRNKDILEKWSEYNNIQTMLKEKARSAFLLALVKTM